MSTTYAPPRQDAERPTGGPEGAAARRSPFRTDIEGLRAIAVLYVVLWHAGLGTLRGGFVGVDVFFVISGFLMTGILLRDLERTGTIHLGTFVRRRLRRLLPASLLVLLLTGLASLFIMPRGRLWSIGLDLVSAVGYVSNWRFAATAVDYLAGDSHPSPVQHFWSLSVEEQYYVAWPLLLLVLAALVGRRVASRTLVAVASAVVLVASLAWSVHYSFTTPGIAYFATTTRAWELAMGGLVAVLLPTLRRVPGPVATWLAWLGLAAVLSSGFLIGASDVFPGWVALLPTVGVAALLAFGQGHARGPERLLSLKPLAWFGSISYSLYLWHWPVLVLGTQALTRGTRALPLAWGLGLAAASVLPAWLSLKWVENPTRRSSWLAYPATTWAIGLTAMSVAMLGCGLVSLRGGHPSAAAVAYRNPDSLVVTGDGSRVPIEVVKGFGADALGQHPTSSAAGRSTATVQDIVPDPARAASDTALTNSRCHALADTRDFNPCAVGEQRPGAVQAMIVGDSHAAQWAQAIRQVARARGWNLTMATKSACPFADVTVTKADGSPYPQCADWNRAALARLTGPAHPDIVFTSNSNYVQFAEGGDPAVTKGLAIRYRALTDAGVKVFVIRDTPQAPSNVADCVDANRSSLGSCAFDRAGGLARRDQDQPAAVKGTRARLLDLVDYVCPATQCVPVIGTVLVWRDSNHITDTYSRTLAARLDALLGRA